MSLRHARVRCGGVALVACAAMGLAGSAFAQDSQSVAAAESLFQDGRKLMAAGKYAEACPKLAESLRLDPGIGTLLYLADCYEKNGQTASAWARFREAADMAKAAGQTDREKKAREHAQNLEGQLVRLTITVAPAAASIASLSVQRDGVDVGKALWGTAVPVDPGTHRITASAPAKKTWSTAVEIAAQPGANATATVPALEDAPTAESGGTIASASNDRASPTGPPPDSGGSRMGPQRIAGIVVGAVGLVGIGVGAAFGIIAKSKNDAALDPQNCPDATHCYHSGIELTNDAKTAATVSTIAFVVGGAALVGGTVLFLTAPKRAAASAASAPRVSVRAGLGRVALGATF